MFIRYHLIYYAIGLVISVCAMYCHYLFFLLFFLYLLFIYKRLGILHLLLITCFSFCIYLKEDVSFEYPTSIEGVITKCGDTYDYIQMEGYTIKLYNDYDFQFRDRVKIEVEYLDINTNSNDYAFNEELYLKGQKVVAKAKLINVKDVENQYGFYHYIEKRLSKHEDVRKYQKLLILGEKDISIEEEYETLSDLSLVHLFALSGMHVSILYALLNQIFGCVFSKKFSQILCYILIGFYVFSIPFSISLMRAYFTLVLSGVFKKCINKLDILGILIIMSLFYNPYYIYNVSFVFSYFIYFIVILTKNYKNSFFYIYLSSLPIILNINYEFSILSLLSGDVLNPFIEVFYTLNCLSVVFPFFDIILAILVSCLNSIIGFLDYVSLRMIVGKPNLSFFVFYYVIYFMILMNIEKKKNPGIYINVLVSLIVAFSFYSRYRLYGEVTMIDVGQGDCTLIRLPLNQGTILIDTGGNKDYDIATNTIIPYLKAIGVDHLDYVYISHDDYDHNGALESLMTHFDVKNVIDSYEDYRKIGDMEIEMYDHSYTSESNDNSLIIRVKLPSMSILFMGDASIELEKELCEAGYNLLSDIIKIGHHGSETSTSSLLLEAVKPKVALIGVKENNIYKHPSSKVIDRLNRKGISILRTDIHGMFHIRYYDNKKFYIYE